MARFFASVICLLAAFTGIRADDPLEKRCRAVLDDLAKIQMTLDSLKDNATAAAAMKFLESFNSIPQFIEKKDEAITAEQATWLKREFIPASSRARDMVIIAAKRILADDDWRDTVCAKSKFGKVLIDELNAETTLKGKNLRRAISAYQLRSGGKSWPNDLKELASPDDGSRAFLEGGIDALMNGWGQPFSFRIDQDPKIGATVVVTTKVPYPKKWTELEFK